LVGESIRERLDLVMRWFSNRNIDVTVVEIQLLEDDGQTYLCGADDTCTRAVRCRYESRCV
jgi:hypothetical protein